jgi:hypothetical protein
VFNTLGGCTLAPEPKARWLQRFSHVGDHFALGKAGDFSDFFKGNPVGPGSPNDPIRTVLGWFRFFYPGNRIAGLFGLHVNRLTIISLAKHKIKKA